MNTKLSVVVNAHSEREWLNQALDSVAGNVASLQTLGKVESEILLILDSADEVTKQTAYANGDLVRVIETSYSDLSLARNYALSLIDSRFVAFIDGDDIWGADWLAKGLAYMLQLPNSKKVILHPEINMHFGEGVASGLIFRHVGSNSPEFNPTVLAIQNYWSALSFADREIYQDFPFREKDPLAGTAFEDWTFNIETWNAGFEHHVVPETVHFIREKLVGSMKKDSAAANQTYGLPVNFERAWQIDNE